MATWRLGCVRVGEVDFVTDTYTNLDTRRLEGVDVGIYYNFETAIGMFDLRYNGSFYGKFEQTASGELSTAVLAAQEADPTIVYPLRGLGDLLGIDGNQDERHSASVAWRERRLGRLGSGVQDRRIRPDSVLAALLSGFRQ